MKKIYFDNAATTQLDPSVVLAMREAESKCFGNPSSVHSFGQQSKVLVETARNIIAKSIQGKSGEIYFTSGGTESNNLALIGTALANRNKGNHIITTAVEHPSIINTCKFLESIGFEVTYLDVDTNGQIDINQLEKFIREETILISIMMVNNEIGNIFPIKEVGEFLNSKNIIFHCDAIQAFGKMDFSVVDFNIDLLSISAHKIYGPKGVGVLYIRTGTKIQNIFYGGAQENNRRPGTENIVGIAGFSEAVEQVIVKKDIRKNIKKLRNHFEEKLSQTLPDIIVNCKNSERVYSHSNIYFPNVSQDSLVLNLDLEGIACSSGSACSSGTLNASHVLQAMDFPDDRANHSIRFTFGRLNTMGEIGLAVEKIAEIYRRLIRT